MPGTTLFEIRLLTDLTRVEAVSDALLEWQALSVSVEDACADTEAEQALFGEPGEAAPEPGWQRSLVTALFGDEAAASGAAARLLAQAWAGGTTLEAIAPVPAQDWVRLTQSQFTPVEITPSFWIVPSWHAAPAAARCVIQLDPGLAFGTGTHPTTRMCLRWIAAHREAVEGQRALDYGCGSGILAIAAARFGAAHVDAVDIDAAAVQAARENAEANGIDLVPGLPDSLGAPAGSYGVVLANILATPLQVLAPLLSGHVAPGGHLLLSGILERQTEALQSAYAPWLALEVGEREDGWVLLKARRCP